MAGFTKRRFFRGLLTTFRWCRISVWLVILAAVSAVFYLHVVGLPKFVKTPLLRELRQRGFDAQFSDMRLGWTQEILVSDVSFGRAEQPLSPSLSVGSAEVRLDFMALLHRQFKISSLRIAKGKIRVPFAQTNAEPFLLEQVQLGLKFLPGDCVQLDNARATFHGIDIHLQGVLTNFSAISTWKSPSPDQATKTNIDWQAGLRQFMDVAQKISFTAQPELYGTVSGDARNPNTLRAEVRLLAAGAKTPWGEMSNFHFKATCAHIIDPGTAPFATLHITADKVATRWGGGSQIDFRIALAHSAEDARLLHGTVDFSGATLSTEWVGFTNYWVKADHLNWGGAVTFNTTNYALSAVEGKVQAQQVNSYWGSMERADASFESVKKPGPKLAGPSWGAWAKAEPFTLDWQMQATRLKGFDLELESLNFSGNWRAPNLTIDKLESRLYNGRVTAGAHLDVATRALRAKLFSNLDVHRLAPLLTPTARHWLSEFSYKQPPRLEGEIQLTLPAWTNPRPDWRAEVLPTVELSGKFSGVQGAFRNIAVGSADSTFTYSNQTWNVPRLHLVRPDGDVYLDYTGSDQTHDYQFVVDSLLDPKNLISVLAKSPSKDAWLDTVQLAHPPKVHAEIQGNWREPQKISATAMLEVTNLVALGQPIGSLAACFSYTNLLLNATDVQVTQGDRHLTAPLLQFNFANKTMALSNVVSTFNPRPVLRTLAPILPEFLQVIGFENPPNIRAHGSFCVTNLDSVNLHFQIAGERFRWTNVVVDTVAANVFWTGTFVSLTNVQASLYGGGNGSGWASFDCSSSSATEVRFETRISDVDLHVALQSLTGRPPKVEGKLNANVQVAGNSEDRHTWHGQGSANVRDGLLWDIPMFGLIFSAIADGTGYGRAQEAAATFVINNGALTTDDLHIRAAGFRLLYRGTIDADQIDALVEARVLRDTPVIGRFLSFALSPLSKMFECRIVGPVRAPVVKPVFVSGLLHPLQTLKNLIPSNLGQSPAPVETSGEPKKQE